MFLASSGINMWHVIVAALVVVVGMCDAGRHRIGPFDAAVPGRGRVEVQNERGTWGLVCDDVWNDLAAQVFCTCLGYQEFAFNTLMCTVHSVRRYVARCVCQLT